MIKLHVAQKIICVSLVYFENVIIRSRYACLGWSFAPR